MVTISTPFHPETPDELAARIRGLKRHVQVLADAAGVLGAHAAQDLRAELDYISHRVENGARRAPWERPERTPNARQTRDERTPDARQTRGERTRTEHETDADQQRNVP